MKKSVKSRIIKIISAALVICIIGAAAVMGVNAYICSAAKDRIFSAENFSAKHFSADCILVLGAGVRDDGSPSHMLADRISTAVSLYNAGVSDKLLMSGDHGRKDYDEVNCMKDNAMSAGVPSEDIFMDHAGFSTYDSLYRAKAVFGAERVIIVTQEYHLYRALYIAKSLGIEAVGVSADIRSYGGQQIRDIRELLARTKDYMFTLIKPKPKYLGESIDLSGSGDVTNDRT